MMHRVILRPCCSKGTKNHPPLELPRPRRQPLSALSPPERRPIFHVHAAGLGGCSSRHELHIELLSIQPPSRAGLVARRCSGGGSGRSLGGEAGGAGWLRGRASSLLRRCWWRCADRRHRFCGRRLPLSHPLAFCLENCAEFPGEAQRVLVGLADDLHLVVPSPPLERHTRDMEVVCAARGGECGKGRDFGE